MKTPQEIADGIVGMIRVAFLELNENMTVEGLAKHNENMKEAVESIASAIQAEREAARPTSIEMLSRVLEESGFVVTQLPEGGVRFAPPSGHILTPDGVVRKVLGELPLTADGCVATINGTFYTPPDGDPDGICGMAAWADGHAPIGKRVGFPVSYIGADRFWNSNDCYSTREAAEAAKNKEKP